MNSAIQFDVAVHEDGGGIVTITVDDPRLHDSIARLRQRGATKSGSTYRLTVDDFTDVSSLVGHLLTKTTQHLATDTTPDDVREDVFERDDNACIICGCDFNAPAVRAATERSFRRILDHIYPKAQADGVHRPHDISNLATVCGGCDDVFLQGDRFRFDASRLDLELGPYERQLLAWIEKRALFRTDWLTERLNAHQPPGYEVNEALVLSRVKALISRRLVVEVPHIAPEGGFHVFQVNHSHPAVVYVDSDAVTGHDRLEGPELLEERPAADTIDPSERFPDG